MSSNLKNVPIEESELLQLLVKNIQDYAIYALDPEGNVLTWNEGASRLKQYSAEVVRGKHFSIFYSEREQADKKPEAMLRRALENGKVEEEGWRIRRDGTQFWAHVVITAIFDDENNLRGYAKVVRDITEKSRAANRERLLFEIAVESARTTTLEELLTSVVTRVGAYLRWPLGHAYLWNNKQQTLRSTKIWYEPKASERYDDFKKLSEELSFPSGIGLPGRCHKEKKVICISDAEKEPNFPRKDLLNEIELHTAVAIPLIELGKVIAVLEFFSTEIVEDIENLYGLAEILSLQVSRFLERQRILEEQEVFFSASKDLLCYAGFDGYFKRVNPVWMDILGYTPEEALKIPWPDFIHPDDLAGALESGRSQVEKGAMVSTVLRFRHKDGSYRWIQWHSVPIMDREMIYAIGRDITEQQQIEQQLKTTLSLQNAILRGASYAIISVDLDGVVRAFNKGAEDLFGHKAEEFVGVSNPPTLTDQSTWPVRSASLSKTLGKKIEYGLDAMIALANLDTSEEFEWDYVRKDGTKFPALLAVSALRDESNNIAGYMGIIQDLTERKKAEAEKNRLLTIVENSPSLISFGERGGPILYQNRGGNKILGLQEGETSVGTSPFEHHPEWARKVLLEEARPALDEFGFWEGYTAILNRDGLEVPVAQALMLLPAMPGEPQLVATIIRDMTEVKRAESLLKQQAVDLQRSNEELEQFAFLASHDLQEPLRMVCSFLGLLELEYNDKLDDEAREYIHYAIDGGLRMRNLIDCLLDFSRVGRQTLHLESISLQDVVDDALINLKIAIAESKAKITVGKFPAVLGDKVTLTRVIQNLIGNSIKFHGGGPIKIRIEAKELDNEVEVTVHDNGIGIDPKHERKIFLIFQQLHAKSKYPGSGIGLSICKKIIERHGGRIWLDGHTEEGAKFCFTLQKGTNKP